MPVNSRILPKSLKQALERVTKTTGKSLVTLLAEDHRDGQKVIRIDDTFDCNAGMFDLSEGQLDKISDLKLEDPDKFSELAQRVCVHLFGDNVRSFVETHPSDKGDGAWKIVVGSFSNESGWLGVHAYLIPEGIEL